MPRAMRYRVLRKIAHGGMAEIFLAAQIGAEGFTKPVVLKRILPALAADPHFIGMLVDEAHIASSLNHSNLVQVLDLGKSGDQFFLVLEFVDGWSLEQIRRRAQRARTKLPLPLVLHVVGALCRALSYVHRHARDGKALGIVHRDVSPQNVLLGREGEVKLADFGIAKAVGRREKSVTGMIKGKFAYMSPEQSIGGELDARSDLFSVGTLLYILTTGKKPFDAPTDLEVLMQVRKARYAKPSEFVRDFNPEVERFIARALRADRSRRWQSAEQMADRLDAIVAKLGQPSGPAVLKRWLDSLSARDGVLPPGDVRATPAEGGPGTIELETGDLDLGAGISGEGHSPNANANGHAHAEAEADAGPTHVDSVHSVSVSAMPASVPVPPAPVPPPLPSLAPPPIAAVVDHHPATVTSLEDEDLPIFEAEPVYRHPPIAAEATIAEPEGGPTEVVEPNLFDPALGGPPPPAPRDEADLTYLTPPGPDPADVVPEAWAPAAERRPGRRGRAGRFARWLVRVSAGAALLAVFAGGGAYLARSHFPPWLVVRVVAPFDAWVGGWVKRVQVILERDDATPAPAIPGNSVP